MTLLRSRALALCVVGASALAAYVACGGDDDPTAPVAGDASADGATPADAAAQDGGVDGALDAPSCVIDAAGAKTIVDAVEVSIGSQGACILRQGGQIVCRGTIPSPNPFPTSAGAVTVGKLEVGSGFACALDDRSRVWCWGANGSGQIAATPDGGATLDPVLVSKGGVPLAVDDIGVGFSSACAIEHGTRAVYCWGNPASGEMGEVDGGPSSVVATPMPSGIIASAGARFTRSSLTAGQCLIDGPSLTCWGSNVNQQLATATPARGTTTAIPAAVADAGGALPLVDVSMTLSHTCAVDAVGHVYCWGNSPAACGSLAVGNEKVTLVPELGTTTAKVSTGAFDTCAISKDAHLRCFGNQSFGILGNRDVSGTPQPVPQSVVGLDGGGTLDKVARVAAGAFQTCAIVEGACGPTGPGTIYCWGNNSSGVLGNPDAGNVSTLPVPQLLP